MNTNNFWHQSFIICFSYISNCAANDSIDANVIYSNGTPANDMKKLLLLLLLAASPAGAEIYDIGELDLTRHTGKVTPGFHLTPRYPALRQRGSCRDNDGFLF